MLDQNAKVELAEKLTALHCEYAGVPANWVHIIFQDYRTGDGFIAGKPAATTSLTLLIRTGRTADYKRGLLTRLWALVQSATGASDEEIVLGIHEVPPSQAMEMGKLMPNVSESPADTQ
ncbi:hypothetical protein ASC90_27535 [Rhizobium sp. Root1220]|nr:hypothetical protein ASC90_27535 [Rhizobium sp. Root1220]